MLLNKIDLVLKQLEKVVEEKLNASAVAEKIEYEKLFPRIAKMEETLQKQENEIKTLKIVIKETVLNLEQVIVELEKIIK